MIENQSKGFVYYSKNKLSLLGTKSILDAVKMFSKKYDLDSKEFIYTREGAVFADKNDVSHFVLFANTEGEIYEIL